MNIIRTKFYSSLSDTNSHSIFV